MMPYASLVIFLIAADAPACGADALAACLNHLDIPVVATDVASTLPHLGLDASLSDLKEQAEVRGAYARAVQWIGDMPSGSPPSIIQVVLPSRQTHFVAILQTRGNQALIAENDRQMWVSIAKLRSAHWDGIALHLSTNPISLLLLGRFWHAVTGCAWGAMVVIWGFYRWRRSSSMKLGEQK